MPEAPTLSPELRDAHAAAKLGPYLAETWERRAYIGHVAINELKTRQITNVLGNLWHLLNPALSIAVYYLIFGLLLKTTRGVDNFILFLASGLFIFQFTQKATIDGSKAIVGNKGIIKAIRFPRAILPVTSTATEFLATLPTYCVLYIVALLTGADLSLRWILLIPLLCLQFVFNTGAALITARIGSHFADTTQILPFVFRLLLYSSGVIFSVDAYVEDNPLVELLFLLNPLYCFITIGRWTVMGGDFREDLFLSALVWSFFILVVGFLWFRRAEETYARD